MAASVLFNERRNVSGKHSFLNVFGGQASNVLVGIGTTNPQMTLHVQGDMMFSGRMYDTSSNSIWVPGSTVQWQTTNPPPTFTGFAGINYTRQLGLYKYIGADVAYSVNVAGTITGVASSDVTLSVPVPIKLAAYPSNTIIGDLWITINNGANSNAFKSYAQTISGNANNVVIRILTGTTDSPLSTLSSNSTMTLQGTITYSTTLVNSAQGYSVTNVPAVLTQDQLGNFGVNNPFTPYRGSIDVYTNSTSNAALVADQGGSSDIARFYKSGLQKVTITSNGSVGIGTTTADVSAGLQVQWPGTTSGGIVIRNPYNADTSYTALTLGNDSNVAVGATLQLNSTTRSVDGGSNTLTLRNEFGSLRLQGAGGFNTSNGVTILPNGNVGVGTTNPTLPLFVNGFARSRIIAFQASQITASTQFNGTEVAGTNGYSTIAYNIGNCYNATNGRFTPTIAGYYVIMAQLYLKTNNSTTKFTIRQNATTNANGIEIGGAYIGTGVVGEINAFYSAFAITYMNGTTDYVSVWGATGAYCAQNPNNNFTGFLLMASPTAQT